MDRDAAALMGIRVNRVYAITCGIGALMAGACGALVSVVFPITMEASSYLLKPAAGAARTKTPLQDPSHRGATRGTSLGRTNRSSVTKPVNPALF